MKGVNMKSIRQWMIAASLAVIVTIPSAAQDDGAETDFGQTLQREELIEAVLDRNPEIAAAGSAIRAMQARLVVAGSLEDPQLSMALAPLTLDDSSIGASMRLSQEIPWPGRLAARQDRVDANVAMQQAELRRVRIELALRASVLYDRWYLLHRALELNAHHRMIADQMKSSAESQYIVGSAAQQDPLQAEVRITRLLKEWIDLKAETRTIAAAINALLHQMPSHPLPPPVEVLQVPTKLADSDSVADSLIENQPMVESAIASVRETEAEVRIAELEKRPDLMAMAEWSSMWMNEDHRLMAGVGFRLPVRRSRIDAMIREAEANLQSRRSELAAVKDRALLDLHQALYDLDSAREAVVLYEDLLIPASRDQTDAAEAGFSTGRNSFLAVLDAEENLQEVVLGYHTMLIRAWNAAARALAALGDVPFITEETEHE